MEKKVFDLKVEVNLKVTEDDIKDIMVTALEGGISYWACLDNTREEWKNYENDDDTPTSIIATKILLDGKSLYFSDVEDPDEIWELTLDKLMISIGTIILHDEHELSCSNNTLNLDCLDACLADSIIQYALFNEIIFG